jgi:hypothetical protein
MSRGAPDARITNACGYVFGSDNHGVYVVQLDGSRGMLRVKPRYDPEVLSHLRNCSALNPLPVSVDVREYDITQKLFRGCFRKSVVGVDGVDIEITLDCVETMTPMGGETKKTRKLSPMVY